MFQTSTVPLAENCDRLKTGKIHQGWRMVKISREGNRWKLLGCIKKRESEGETSVTGGNEPAIYKLTKMKH